jgi:hypothetical protein
MVVVLGFVPRECGLDGGGSIASPLILSVEAEPRRVVPGGVVRAVLRVTNAGTAAAVLVFPTSQRYDFILVDARGSERWRWSQGLMFTQVLTRESLEPGGSLEYEATFAAPAEEGEYRLIGSLLLIEGTLSDAVVVRVLPSN